MKRKSFILSLFINLFFLINDGLAQYYDLRFQSITTIDGLPSNNVLSILQDSRGFLWFGTYDGLCRFDGFNIITYKNDPDNPKSISGNKIYVIFEDDESNLWIGTFGTGLSRFDRDTETFENFVYEPQNPQSIISNSIFGICQDKNKNLWFGTNKGLCKLDKKNRKFIRYVSDPSDPYTLSSNNISSMVYDSSKNLLWIGTRSGGLNLFDIEKNFFISFKHDDKNPNTLSSNYVFSLLRDKDGLLWIGTYGEGLNKFNPITSEFTVYRNSEANKYSLSNNDILSLFEDRQGRLWIGTYSGGLNYFEKSTKRFYNYQYDANFPDGIGDNCVNKIFQDSFGLLWIGTWNSGVYKTSPDCDFKLLSFRLLPNKGLNDKSIYSILETEKGDVWIGTETGGLNKYDPDSKTFRYYTSNPNKSGTIPEGIITALEELPDGNIIIGTDQQGLAILDTKTDQFSYFKNDVENPKSLSGDVIQTILTDKDNKVWIGTMSGGLNTFNLKTKEFEKIIYNFPDSTSLDYMQIYSLFQSSDGLIWIGTYGQGLFAYNKKTNNSIHYKHNPETKSGLTDNIISAICEDKNGDIWVGTYNGLNKIDMKNKQIYEINLTDGVSSKLIYGILADDNNNIFVSTNNGIFKYNIVSGKVRRYNRYDGLQSDEFNQGAFCKGYSGNFYFGGIRGVSYFNPSLLKDDTAETKIAVSKFSLLNKPVSIGFDSNFNRIIIEKSLSEISEINLNYDENIFSFDLAALDFVAPQNIVFAYKLEGFDKDWIIVTSEKRFATYTNIDPGEYIFKVKSTNHDKIWNKTEKAILINILPPWWKKTWAYLLYGIILISLLYSFRKYDLKRIGLKKELELEHIHLRKLEEVDKLKTEFFENISHEFRTPLTLILGQTEIIQKKTSDKEFAEETKSIRRNANHLLHLINQILDLSKLDQGLVKLELSFSDVISFIKGITMSFESASQLKNLNLTFSSSFQKLDIFFDKDIFETILNNVLSNAMKFTNKGSINVSVNAESENLIIMVEDTGIGIPPEELDKIFNRFFEGRFSKSVIQRGSGLGLTLVKSLVELHKGSIEIKSKLEVGTKVILKIPLFLQPQTEKVRNSAYYLNKEENQSLLKKLKSDGEHLPEQEIISENSMVILIVEDNNDVRDYIKKIIPDTYQIIEAQDGEVGINKALKYIPDLIISDVIMPKADGFKLTSFIKSNEITSHIPIILLTAKSDQRSKLIGLELGADEYLSKPFNSKELLTRIKNLITIRKKIQESLNKFEFMHKKDLPHLSGIEKKFLNKVIEVFKKNLANEHFSVEELSDELAVSRVQLHRKIKALTGKSASSFLRSFRLNEAKKMIDKGEATISEISFLVGFSSPSYFTKCFKEEFGITPTEKTKKNKMHF